jgi:hypothetical protein|tara:strand:+ start:917 stop:1075 length:159 start_codon:yes stop_codon:yes gene_type:complete
LRRALRRLGLLVSSWAGGSLTAFVLGVAVFAADVFEDDVVAEDCFVVELSLP